MTPAPAAAPSAPASSRRPWLVLAAMCLPLLAQSLDVSGIGLLLPSVGSDLHAGPAGLGWVMNANPLAFGALLLASGRLSDRVGPRPLLIAGVAGFGVASALCATAPSLAWLVAFRAAQGLASAACFTTSLAVVDAAFDETRRPAAIGAWGVVSGAGSALGPLAAGVLAATAGWRWFFVVNAPLCLVALPFVTRLTEPGREAGGAIIGRGSRATARPGTSAAATRIGLVAVAVGFAALSLAVGSTVGPLARLAPAAVALASAGLLWSDHRRGRPVVDPRAVAGPWSRSALVVGFSSTWAFGVVLVVGSALLQQVRGLDPLESGLVFLAFSASFAVAGAAVGRMVGRSGLGSTMGLGMVATVTSLVVLGALPLHAPLALIAVALAVGGAGQGLAFDGSTTASLAGIDEQVAGQATAAVQTVRLLGSVLGVAAAAAIVATAGTGSTSVGDRQRTAFLLAAAVAAAGTALARAVRRPPPTASAAPPGGRPHGGAHHDR